MKHIRKLPKGEESFSVAVDGIERAAGQYLPDDPAYLSTWWEWGLGSTPFFWNWPAQYQESLRDGQPHFIVGEFGKFIKPQRAPKTERDGELVRDKVLPVRMRRYIEEGLVRSLTHYFYVAKGLEDIRMVYNGTSCGLNDIIWAPHFGLPTVKQTTRSLLPGYSQCDMDIGEMFLNFLLHEKLKEMAGVDIRYVRSKETSDVDWEKSRENNWERWCRNFMGLRDSPFRSIQQLIRLKIAAYGDRRDKTNPFHWEKVIFNLPGTPGYRPGLPWVMKVRFDGHLACEVYVYVDDGRATGHSREICWAAARKFASLCSKFGVQDAARKRTFPSLMPGPWAGTVTHTDLGMVSGRVSQGKWEKTQALIRELASLVRTAAAEKDKESKAARIPRQRLLEIRGFLNYVVRTYSWLNPYLKGMHNTIDGWRRDYDDDGWKLRGKALQAHLRFMPCRREHDEDAGGDGAELGGEAETEEAPDLVVPVERLSNDVTAMLALTEGKEPPRGRLRPEDTLVALYLPGDASGSGFGSAVIKKDGIIYQSGTWVQDWREESSNFREADNLVMRIETLVEEGTAVNHEVFVFTDNQVFESCFYKGYSKTSPKLANIILKLYKASRDGHLVLHVIHVAGTRMKAWGVDGLSRGDLLDGMMAGENPLSFIPLALGADERAEGRVGRWIRSWWQDRGGDPWGQRELVEITKDNMFELPSLEADRLWMLAPAAMETAMELFNEDRIAHPWNAHVFAIPRIMTHLWRKNLGKDADLIFSVAPGKHFWQKCQYEPLTIAIVLPLAYVENYRGPWTARGTPAMECCQHELESGFKLAAGRDPRELPKLASSVHALWKDPEGRSRSLLLQLLDQTGSLFRPVQECLLRRMLPRKRVRSVSKASRTRKRSRRKSAAGA